MCYGCWQDYKDSFVYNDKVSKAVPLIRTIYDSNGVGANLHIVLDDWNLEDGHVQFCKEAIFGDKPYHAPVMDAEKELVILLEAMTENERASSLAIFDKYVDEKGNHLL